jgi:hypothetical protein
MRVGNSDALSHRSQGAVNVAVKKERTFPQNLRLGRRQNDEVAPQVKGDGMMAMTWEKKIPSEIRMGHASRTHPRQFWLESAW